MAVFTKATADKEFETPLYGVEGHLGGGISYYADDPEDEFDDYDYDYGYDDDDDYYNLDPYYCEQCGDSDTPLGWVNTSGKMLEQIAYSGFYGDKISREDAASTVSYIQEGNTELEIPKEETENAIQYLVEQYNDSQDEETNEED